MLRPRSRWADKPRDINEILDKVNGRLFLYEVLLCEVVVICLVVYIAQDDQTRQHFANHKQAANIFSPSLFREIIGHRIDTISHNLFA